MGQNITSGQNFDLERNATCLNSTAVDLYYMPNTANTLYGGLHHTPTQYHPNSSAPSSAITLPPQSLPPRREQGQRQGNLRIDNVNNVPQQRSSTSRETSLLFIAGASVYAWIGYRQQTRQRFQPTRRKLIPLLGTQLHHHNSTTTPTFLPPSSFLSSMPYGNVAQDPCRF